MISILFPTTLGFIDKKSKSFVGWDFSQFSSLLYPQNLEEYMEHFISPRETLNKISLPLIHLAADSSDAAALCVFYHITRVRICKVYKSHTKEFYCLRRCLHTLYVLLHQIWQLTLQVEGFLFVLFYCLPDHYLFMLRVCPTTDLALASFFKNS